MTSKITLFCIVLFISIQQVAAQTCTYKNDEGEKHLCGRFEIADLENDTTYNKWYISNYNEFDPELKDASWKKNLQKVNVDIFMGTWCGDSKNWLPKFVKLWDELGLKRSQLTFTALYDSDIEGKYKQGPNGEEKGLDIHRVPVFLFKRDGKEIGRIVESPATDLITDVAQIALGYPSQPNYKAATYIMNLLNTQSMDSINAHINDHFYEIYHLVGKVNELNTLGYVYMDSDLDRASFVFMLNTYLYKHNPNVYDSYAEVLLKMGYEDKALTYYKKVLELEPKNENALEQVAMLEAKAENKE